MTSLQIPQPTPDTQSAANVVWLDGRHGLVELTWRAGLLEQIRSFVGSTYVSRSGKGNDVGGVFYGHRKGESIQVLTWRPIARTKDATSHFYLNPKEEQSLQKMLRASEADSSLNGMEVVGWFRSKTKGEPEMDQQDIQFHDKFFNRSWNFAMVIRPSHQRPAEASLYLTNDENEFELNRPVAMLSLMPGPVGVSNSHGTTGIPGVALDRATGKPAKSFPWTLFLALFALAAMVSVGAILGLQWNEQREAVARPAENLGFELVFDGEDLKARWNPSATAIATADNAQLLLGGERLQLSHAELAQGFLKVPMKSSVQDDTEISLKVGDREEVAQLVVAAR